MNRSLPLLLAILLAGTRVTLVSTCGGKAGENLLTLAAVTLSADETQIVDRHA